jgi:hypothetical protein
MAQGLFMRTSVSKRAGRPFSLGSTSKRERFLMRFALAKSLSAEHFSWQNAFRWKKSENERNAT